MHRVIEKCFNAEDITWQEYCQGANCTLADTWHGDRYPVATALAVIEKFLEVSKSLDELKKALFYGDGKDGKVVEYVAGVHAGMYGESAQTVDSWDDVLIDHRLIHSILGIAPESAELVDALYQAIIAKEDIDAYNFLEEIGDLMWYIHIPWVISKTGAGLSPVLRKNLLKLYQRYGDKFSNERAFNRDLEAERKVLEETV